MKSIANTGFFAYYDTYKNNGFDALVPKWCQDFLWRYKTIWVDIRKSMSYVSGWLCYLLNSGNIVENSHMGDIICNMQIENKMLTEEDMLNSKGFDLWADDYDKSVGVSDEDRTYPFAGYKDILNKIYSSVLTESRKVVLDIGFGTGTLTSKLYENGCDIYGQDFSSRMIELAYEKMPNAKLFQGDFSVGLANELVQNRYDAIIATYSLHHLTDMQKIDFLNMLITLLNDEGCIYIGDVAFKTRKDMELCKMQMGNEWDDDEIYFVFNELKEYFPQLEFEQVSYCAGILYLKR